MWIYGQRSGLPAVASDCFFLFMWDSLFFCLQSCDLWSLGVIIYVMLCGYPPFYSKHHSRTIPKDMRKKIMTGSFDFPEEEWSQISEMAKDIVRKWVRQGVCFKVGEPFRIMTHFLETPGGTTCTPHQWWTQGHGVFFRDTAGGVQILACVQVACYTMDHPSWSTATSTKAHSGPFTHSFCIPLPVWGIWPSYTCGPPLSGLPRGQWDPSWPLALSCQMFRTNLASVSYL